MPFYHIDVGFRMYDVACARIKSTGIPSEIYATPVRIITFVNSSNNTVFSIEADDEIIANEWAIALKTAITTTTEYTPEVVEDPDPPPFALDTWARVGQWTKSVGNATTTISGLPGTPKGIIVWGSGLSGSTLGTYDEAGGIVIGFSNGTDNRDLACAMQDNVNPTNANRSVAERAFHLIDPAGDASTHVVTNENCTITFDTDSFDMNWNATTLATVGHYHVFGGDDVSLVEIKDFQFNTTTTGEKIYTGLAEQNDFCMLFAPFITFSSGYPTGGFAGALNSVSVHARADNTKTWCTNIRSGDNLTDSTSTHRLQRKNKVLHTMGGTSSAQQQVAEWAGWTADGFKLNWIDSPSSPTTGFTGMFVKGGNWDAGSLLQPTAIGEVTTLIAPSTAVIQAIMAFSVNNPDNSTNTIGVTPAKWTIGAEDLDGNRGCLSYSGATGVWPSREATLMVSDKFMKHITSDATASSSITNAECVVSDIATQGEFTVDYTTVDSTARHVVWFALSA